LGKRIGDKAERVLKLLLGLRNKRIASELASRGFSIEDLEEGFRLLRGVTAVTLAVLPPTKVNPPLLLEIDRWENKWFPVASATLKRHYPEIHAQVFLNLSQSHGPGVVISVGTFIKRLDALTTAVAGYGQPGVDARALLERRGLSPEIVGEVKALLARLECIEDQPDEPVDVDRERARLAKAETTMWAWYLEWSFIARAAIKNRRLLRLLGFLQSSSSSVSATPNKADKADGDEDYDYGGDDGDDGDDGGNDDDDDDDDEAEQAEAKIEQAEAKVEHAEAKAEHAEAKAEHAIEQAEAKAKQAIAQAEAKAKQAIEQAEQAKAAVEQAEAKAGQAVASMREHALGPHRTRGYGHRGRPRPSDGRRRSCAATRLARTRVVGDVGRRHLRRALVAPP
jgi:hypothetical protein